MAKAQKPAPQAEPKLYDDEEMASASGVPIPSLRVLQAGGAIKSTKVAKEHGGFRRMWAYEEVMKAAIAGALCEHFSWNIRLAAQVLARLSSDLWSTVIIAGEASEIDIGPPKGNLIGAKEDDLFVELVDRKFLFLRVTEAVKFSISRLSKYNEGELLLGYVGKDSFVMVPWGLDVRANVLAMRKVATEAQTRTAVEFHYLALLARQNFLSKATINLSMQARAASERLKGRKARFVQDLVQPRTGGSSK